MLRLPFLGTRILRYLLVLLLALAPFGAPSAAVSVTGSMTCSSASSISYDLDQNRMSFFCGTDSLTYSCSPTAVDYGTGTQVIAMTCASGSGTVLGLVVNAMVDGAQDGNGSHQDGGGTGAICNNANAFNFEPTPGRYTWQCDNGGGSTKSVKCYTSAVVSQFNLGGNEVDMDCVTLFSRSGFEDSEPPFTDL
jgi:hypothetical protein